MKKVLIFCMCVCFLFVAGPAFTADKIVLKAAHVTAKEYPYHFGFETFAKSVAAKTNGRVEVQIFPNGQLAGSEREAIESLQTGSLDITVVNASAMTVFTPRIAIFALPYMFRDLPHFYKAIDGEVGKAIGRDIDAKGLKFLTFYINPPRGIFTSKRPIRTLADMKGLKHRVIPSPVKVDTFAAFGAIPTPMAYGELYSALQQGVVDSGDDVTRGYLSMKFNEVAKYYTLSGHDIIGCPVMISPKTYNSLSPDIQKAVVEASYEGAVAMRKYFEEAQANDIKAMKGMGVVYSELQDKPNWVKAAIGVQQKYEKDIGKDLMDTVRAIK
jgi:tripartite ATP-independent transporter DctP family solute receptor